MHTFNHKFINQDHYKTHKHRNDCKYQEEHR